jgi:hypothetical protein
MSYFLELEISAKDIEIARVNKTMPVTVAFERQFYFAKARSGPVCAVMQRRDGLWMKLKFPFRMWDWNMTFIQGGIPEPTMLRWSGKFDEEQESILLDPNAKDFRKAERISVQTVQAE